MVKQLVSDIRALMQSQKPHPDTLCWLVYLYLDMDKEVRYDNCWMTFEILASNLDWWTDPNSVMVYALVGTPNDRDFRNISLLQLVEDMMLWEIFQGDTSKVRQLFRELVNGVANAGNRRPKNAWSV